MTGSTTEYRRRAGGNFLQTALQKGAYTPTPAEATAATRMVDRYATRPADREQLLDALGLNEEGDE